MIAFLKRSIGRQKLPFQRAIGTESKFVPPFDPFRYTQGRWLDRDEERRNARNLHFNFDALMDVAIESSPGARRVIHCDKKEGGFNRVFMIHLDNNHTVAARLPNRLAGPPCLALSSEVATLQFVKEKTTIPVPSVLSWNADSKNDVGTEYMILDAMPGVPLKDVWHDMTASQHVACIRSIGRLCKQLCQLNFPVYGSLFLNTESPSNAVRLDDIFCVGPLCAPQHWDCSIDTPPGARPSSSHQGPWRDVKDYHSDLITRARASLRMEPRELRSAHCELLDVLQQSLSLLITTTTVQSASRPMLSHPDLHTRNIFVDSEDHTRVTGIIDWQSAAIEPAFVFASETPDFAEELTDDEDPGDMTNDELATKTKLLADVDFCVKTWAVMQQTCKKLRPASRLDFDLLRVLAAPSFGWIGKTIILHTLLDNLAKKWKQLGLPGESLYQPSKAQDLVQRLDEYQASRRVQDHLAHLLRCDDDGWVPNDRWEEVLRKYRSEYSRFVESVVNSEECRNEEEKALAVEMANRLWPYDQR